MIFITVGRGRVELKGRRSFGALIGVDDWLSVANAPLSIFRNSEVGEYQGRKESLLTRSVHAQRN